MTQEGWQPELTRAVAAQVRRYREQRGMSAQRLADRCEELGFPIPRPVLSNLENGRRESVSLAELLVLAAALEVPPVELAFPLGDREAVDVLPGVAIRAWDAARWFGGDGALVERNGHISVIFGEEMARFYRGARELPIDLLSVHQLLLDRCYERENAADQMAAMLADPGLPAYAREGTQRAVAVFQNRRQEDARELRLHRDFMRRRGMSPPPLPAELAAIDHAPPERDQEPEAGA